MRQMAVLFLLMTLLGCAGAVAPGGNTPEPKPEATPFPGEVLDKPAMFVGRTVAVEGVLEAEGTGAQVRFFLRDDAGRRLEVSSWAPLEVMHPPQGGTGPKTMADFVGRRLLLNGVLERGGEGYILKVTSVEEK
ncbi:MAG: hypothetical protein ACP5OO_11280 [Chloroflexia bacterium]